MRWTRRTLIATPAAFLFAGCSGRRDAPRAQPVRVYTSLDEPYSRPVFEAFTAATGVPVEPVYDTEANKSRGLALRLEAERKSPLADVWWSSEVLQTVRLARSGVLEAYRTSAADGIPDEYHDAERRWYGFAGRYRVFAVNRKLAAEAGGAPLGMMDLLEPRWKGRVAMANPLFGTTTTEAAALRQVWGGRVWSDYYRARATNETRILDGNSMTAEQASTGQVAVGQTDTDDAFIRRDAGAEIEVIYPDQQGMGALMIPNTAGIVASAPHPESARRFLDFLVSPAAELLMAALPSKQVPLNREPGGNLHADVREQQALKTLQVDYNRLVEHVAEMESTLRELFLR